MESKELIQAVQDSVSTKVITSREGYEYSSRPIFTVKIPSDPSPLMLAINTLSGLLGFLKSNDWRGKEGTLIHVMSPNEVVVVSGLYGVNKQRDTYCLLKHEPLFGKDFEFGKFFEQEPFVIALMTLFGPTPNRDELLRIVANIKTEEILQAQDNGVSQGVVTKAGVALVEATTVPNPVMLKPFRTFREVDQPISPFVVRLKKGNPMPQLALFECDGGMWKIEAMERIVVAIQDIQAQAGAAAMAIKIIA